MILALFFHGIYATICALILSLVIGQLTVWISVVSLGVGFFLGWRSSLKFRRHYPELKFLSFQESISGALEMILSVFVLYIATRHFMWLLAPMDHKLTTLSATNFGDLPLHINYIRAIADGGSFPPLNPSFAQELLRYPFGSDLYNALWARVGVPLSSHLFLTGIAATLASLILLRVFAGWWGIAAFFLSGGLAGWQVFRGVPLQNFDAAVDWKNLFLAMFITQRGMLFALPLGLLLLVLVRGHFSASRRLGHGELRTLGIFWGFLPFFHLHTFVAVSLLIGSIAFEQRRTRGLKELFLSPLFAHAFLPAVVFVLYSTNFFQKAGVAHWDWAWMANWGDEIWFFSLNFGPWLLLPIAIALALIFSRSRFSSAQRRNLWIEWGVYVFLSVLFLNLMLAPWAWDNVKVLIWPYLGFARLTFLVLNPLIGRHVQPVIAFVFSLTGLLVLIWSVQTPAHRAVTLYEKAELAKVEGALKKVPASAIFAAAPTHHHPLSYFGRFRVLGYEGHLWSHGIDSKAITQAQDLLMKGEGDWRVLVKELGVDNIFWGPEERKMYGGIRKPWMNVLPNISSVPEYEIYAVKPSPVGGVE